MNARGQRTSKHQIGREQVSRTAGVVARTVREGIDTGEAISVGTVNLVKNTALAALSGARNVGAEAGSVAVAAVRGSITATQEIRGELGRVSGPILNGTFGAARKIGNNLMNLLSRDVKKRPLAKATSRRRSRTSERKRTTRRSAQAGKPQRLDRPRMKEREEDRLEKATYQPGDYGRMIRPDGTEQWWVRSSKGTWVALQHQRVMPNEDGSITLLLLKIHGRDRRVGNRQSAIDDGRR